MKNRKQSLIEHSIRTEMKSSTPEVREKIDFNAIYQLHHGYKKVPWYKNFKIMAFPSVVVAAALIIFAILLTPSDTGLPLPNPTDPQKTLELSSKEEVYSISAMQAVTLLHQNASNGGTAFNQFTMLNTTASASLNHFDQMSYYLNMLEPILLEEEARVFSIEESDLEDYAYKITYDTANHTFNEYTLYYNETEIDEKTFELEGIMVIEGVDYRLSGRYEDDDDTFKLELIATHPTQEDTYIELIQEIKNDEQVFEYIFVEDDEDVYESSLSIEFDEDEISAAVEFESEALEFEFEIIRPLTEETYAFYIEYEIERGDDTEFEGVVEVRVNRTNNTYIFDVTTDDDETFTLNKPRIN